MIVLVNGLMGLIRLEMGGTNLEFWLSNWEFHNPICTILALRVQHLFAL